MPHIKAAHAATVATLKQLPRAPIPEIAITGRSNVGKSSLINTLVNKTGLAKTSSTPGKTRQLIFFSIDDDRFNLVDLPGYGFANAPVAVKLDWQALIEPYLTQREQLAGLIALLDVRHAPSELDLLMMNWLTECEIRFLVVLTKCDKLSRNKLSSMKRQIEKAISRFGYDEIVPTSAKTGIGVGHVWSWMNRATEEHRSFTNAPEG